MKKITLISILASLIVLSCAQSGKKDKSSSVDAQTLHVIIDSYSDGAKHLDAYEAPYFNVEEDLAHIGDYPTKAFYGRYKALYVNALEKLKAIQTKNLSPQDLRTYSLFKEDMETNLKSFDYPDRYLVLNQMDNRFHNFVDATDKSLTTFPFDTVKHYDAFLSRAREFPQYVENQIQLLRQGMDENVTLSCTVAKQVPNSYKDGLEPNILKSPFYRPVLFMPETFSAEDKQRLTASFKDVVEHQIMPAYKKFDKFFKDDYSPHCRKQFGLFGLPKAEAWYKFEILQSTGLDLDPQAIHQLGLNEVQRISQELEKIKKKKSFRGSLRDFMRSQAKSSKSYFKTGPELFAAFKKVKERSAAAVKPLFSVMPKTDFEIVETSNPEDAAGSYNQPSEMSPIGRFVANTKNLRAVPKYGVTTLMLHETVPGHHFQLALQYEMKDKLSEYQRKIFNSNAFVEGWALYSERLGYEMGMYEDPEQAFGNLNDEMLRAVRLVVDTGIHSMGWDQKKAIAYMTDHLASDSKDILNEVNRYSVWPGQALGYKIGQLKIMELRKKAETALGAQFDIKEFHKAVIGNGTVSLKVLEDQVNDYIKTAMAPPPKI